MPEHSEEIERLPRGWVIRWRYYISDNDTETSLEGPYESVFDAEDAAKERWSLIDPWHDATWEVLPINPAGQFPRNLRVVSGSSKEPR